MYCFVTFSPVTISLCLLSFTPLPLLNLHSFFAACGLWRQEREAEARSCVGCPWWHPGVVFPFALPVSVEQQPHSFPGVIGKWQCPGRSDHKPKWQVLVWFDWMVLIKCPDSCCRAESFCFSRLPPPALPCYCWLTINNHFYYIKSPVVFWVIPPFCFSSREAFTSSPPPPFVSLLI